MKYPKVIYKDQPKAHSWCRWSVNRVKNRNNSTNIRFVGDTGCQPEGSKVLMANGEWKNIKRIQIGDEVLSPQEDGSYKFGKIKEIFKWKSKKNYDIFQLNRQKAKLYSCSHNHNIPVWHNYKKKGLWEIKRITAENMTLRPNSTKSHQDIGFSSPPIPNFKGRKNCEVEPYTLGAFLGDGMFRDITHFNENKNYKFMKRSDKKKIHKRTYREVCITTMDLGVIEEISKYYPIMNITQKKDNKAKSYYFSINSELGKSLKKYKLNGKKSGDKFIPKEALLSDIDYRKKLLAGLIDTDGYLSKKCAYSITTKSKKLSENILFLIYSLGGRGRITKVKKGIKKLNFTGEYYRVSFFIHNLKIPVKIKRKSKQNKSCYISSNRIAINVKPSKEKYLVYGFTVDTPSHFYITDNFMVTGNSGKSWSALSMFEIMCKLMKKEVNPDNFYFSISDVIRRVAKKPPKPGTIFFIDEQQVEGDSTQHNTLKGRAYTTFFSTVRSKRYIIISTMPYADMVIKKVRRFFHLEIETKGVNETTQTVRTAPRYLEYHKSKDKVYRKRLVVVFTDKDTGIRKARKISTWEIPRPSTHLINIYEKLKAEFQQKTYDRLVKDLDRFEGIGDDSSEKTLAANEKTLESLTEYQKALYEKLNEHPDLAFKEISRLLEEDGIASSPAKVSQNIPWMKNKGVIILKRVGRKKVK